MTVTPRAPATVTLPLGKLLVVQAAPKSRGAIWRIPPNMYGKRSIIAWAEANALTTLGPYADTRTLRIEALSGEIDYEVQDLIVAQLENQISRIRSATVIAKALNEGKRAMSVLEKFKHLAERSKAVPAKLGDRADKALARWDAVESRGNGAIDNLDNVIDQAEQSAAVMEDALNQLTNGGPALDPLEPSA